MLKFYESRGELKLEEISWREPSTDEEKNYDGKAITEVREMNVEFVVKGNPFVKSSPTVKHFKIIERSSTKIVMRVLNRCHSIPYADCFGIEEEWFV